MCPNDAVDRAVACCQLAPKHCIPTTNRGRAVLQKIVSYIVYLLAFYIELQQIGLVFNATRKEKRAGEWGTLIWEYAKLCFSNEICRSFNFFYCCSVVANKKQFMFTANALCTKKNLLLPVQSSFVFVAVVS